MVKAMSELRDLTIIAIDNAYPVNLTKKHEEKYKDMYVDYLNRGLLSVAADIVGNTNHIHVSQYLQLLKKDVVL